MTKKYRKGSIIEYKTFDGERRKVLVTDKVANIKNGRDGFDGLVLGIGVEDYSVWGYDHQITRVIAR
tara:strand:- start:405 stop:605 length:201 start_codon:yes stop_codon:yes gene_type:complete